MDSHRLCLDLIQKFPGYQLVENHPLAPYTTLKIGGPADIFFQPKSSYQFKSILNFVYQVNQKSGDQKEEDEVAIFPSRSGGMSTKKFVTSLPVTILGNGSNVLISDSGIRGLVIRNVTPPKIKAVSGTLPPLHSSPAISPQRNENNPSRYLDFSKIDYNESDRPRISVQMSSGTPLPTAINYCLERGWTGLQWFAYIPGTIGGAAWYNTHGGQYHFSDYIHKITVFNLKTGKKETYSKTDFSWDYDTSPFQSQPHLIILAVTLRLFLGNVDHARATALSWIAQKSKVQPMNSAGSVFKNPTLAQCLPIWGEQKSAGWIIDHELKLKNFRLNDILIGPQHANIFTNQGRATAADFFTLIQKVRSEAKKQLHLDLNPEIKFLGDFPPSPVHGR